MGILPFLVMIIASLYAFAAVIAVSTRKLVPNPVLRWVVLPIAALAFVIWGWYWIDHPSCTIRYKMTAEVMTPDGVKTGSSVTQVTYWSGTGFDSGRTSRSEVIGEALYVDLGQSKNLFITLTGYESSRTDPGHSFRQDYATDAGWLLVKTLGLAWKGFDERELCKDFARFDGAIPKEAGFQNLPLIVSFKDITDFRSAVEVDPANLGATFGDGYSLSKVTLAVSNAEPTVGLDNVLTWFPVKKKEWATLGNRDWATSYVLRLNYLGAFKQPPHIGELK